MQQSTDDHSWKMVGTGDFDRDGITDIVWEDPNADAHKVWYMNTNGTVRATGYFQTTGDIGWRVVGVGDFNNDGWPDLLWQHPYYQSGIWYVTNMIYSGGCSLEYPSDPNWRIASVIAKTGSNPIILWKHQTLGQYGLWYRNMGGCTAASYAVVAGPQGQYLANLDQDLQVVGFWDMNGDQSPDMLFRHATLGINSIWYLGGCHVLVGDP